MKFSICLLALIGAASAVPAPQPISKPDASPLLLHWNRPPTPVVQELMRIQLPRAIPV
ncbi:hypothetical protein AA313_de0204915 [Arthrobotrys entomopaga]|nr:hypothetical protein AA313_de0204915 [Arthrobotrys entomopaga]